MAGWNLKNGIIKNIKKKEDTIHKEVADFFSKKTVMKNMYKIYLFQSLIGVILEKDLLDENTNIFTNVNYYFGKKYWDFLNELDISITLAIFNGYNKKSSQEENIEYIKRKYKLKNISFDKLDNKIKKEYLELTAEVIKRNVIGALYSNFDDSIYSFDTKLEEIKMNKFYILFFKTNADDLKKISDYRLIELIKTTEKDSKLILKIIKDVFKVEFESNYYKKIDKILSEF